MVEMVKAGSEYPLLPSLSRGSTEPSAKEERARMDRHAMEVKEGMLELECLNRGIPGGAESRSASTLISLLWISEKTDILKANRCGYSYKVGDL